MVAAGTGDMAVGIQLLATGTGVVAADTGEVVVGNTEAGAHTEAMAVHLAMESIQGADCSQQQRCCWCSERQPTI